MYFCGKTTSKILLDRAKRLLNATENATERPISCKDSDEVLQQFYASPI